MQSAVQLLPLTHAVQIIRPIVVGQPITNLWLHLVSLLVFGVLATWVASALIRRRLIK
jgi:lipooligosaccharide transport system permease protein